MQPGLEYDRICRDIVDALYEMVDPDSGRKVVKRITLALKEFEGPYLSQLPDLTVLWDQSFPWTSVQSPRLGTLNIRRQDARSGSHTPHGFYLAHGSQICSGPVACDSSIYDIAPTVLKLAGVPIPCHIEGRPLPFLTGTPELTRLGNT